MTLRVSEGECDGGYRTTMALVAHDHSSNFCVRLSQELSGNASSVRQEALGSSRSYRQEQDILVIFFHTYRNNPLWTLNGCYHDCPCFNLSFASPTGEGEAFCFSRSRSNRTIDRFINNVIVKSMQYMHQKLNIKDFLNPTMRDGAIVVPAHAGNKFLFSRGVFKFLNN